MELGFKALILTYKTADVRLRESAALDAAGCQWIIQQLKEFSLAQDVLVLSTCNRTEVYYQHEADLSREIINLFRLRKDSRFEEDLESAFICLNDSDEAVRHLFRVSIGLESQVPGDMQIIHQVKQAYQWSVDLGVAGPFLHRLLHTIFFANKRVVQETSFRTGAASVAFVAQELAEEMLPLGIESRLLVLGVGEMGSNLCRNLSAAGYKNVQVLNRTVAKAQELAEECGFTFSSLDALANEIPQADLIISCLTAREPVVHPVSLSGVPQGKRLILFDLSMPRSVSPDVEQNPAVFLYNIDDLQARASEALELRLAEIPKVEAIMAEAMAGFEDWSREMLVSPAIQKFKEAMEKIRQEEMARFLKQLPPDQMELVDKITGNIVQKIIKMPVLELKAACRRGDAENMMESLVSLFNLEEKAL